MALLCAEANARTPKVLSENAAAEIRGKTLTSVVHEPRDVNIFGMNYLGDKEDLDALKSTLGGDLVTVKRDRGPGLLGDLTGTTDGYRVLGASVYDPAPHMAERIQAALASRFGVRPLDQQPKVLPATTVDRTVPEG
jgi:hypothetical protein